MFDNKGRYVIEDYGVKSTFSSFLPGISGKFGIPIWCFYVNRGQGVTSFGTLDKEHSIMEFYPAHQSYQNTKYLGFRTFLKVQGKYYEPFQAEEVPKKMYIGKNEIEVEETSKENQIKTNALYFTLPSENLGALVRKVTIKNIGKEKSIIEILDGMPALLPYGVNISSMKNMGQTTKAWMQVEDVLKATPYFRVRVSMEDTADVHEIEGGHFYLSYDEEGNKLPILVDPDLVFEYDTSLTEAVGWKNNDVETLLLKKQVDKNNLPCAFSCKKVVLEAGEEVVIHSVIGQVANKEILNEFSSKCMEKQYFHKKYKEAIQLTEDLCEVMETKTASPVFDAYCKHTYLDNLLRGGCPTLLGKDKVFYLYSRKHGDIERDYNFFSMLPEFYSQGNANFRDVNQNRRCDVLFHPFAGEYNIKLFYNLIQTDGYNPLAVQKTTYSLNMKDISWIEKQTPLDLLKEYLAKSFTPGELLHFLEENKIKLKVDKQDFLEEVIHNAKENVNAEFEEGYWSDHWTYNLDFIESYLMVYPEKERELLFRDHSYTYFESKAVIKPRRERYIKTEKGIRQYHAIDKALKKDVTSKQVRTGYGMGELFTSNLMEKLILLNITKVAALDSFGMGVEMEGGKPGWYDALNGLPGIFGSSMCETYELHRNLLFTIEILKKYEEELELVEEIGLTEETGLTEEKGLAKEKGLAEEIELAEELSNLMEKVMEAIKACDFGKGNDKKIFECWDRINDAKEEYREITAFGLHGATRKFTAKEILIPLECFLAYVNAGIQKALNYGNGICPSYFVYKVKKYEELAGKIVVKEFKPIPMPHFLEGPVRFLKLNNDKNSKKELYEKVKNSGLYDTKLKMYKVNESLEKASFEIGRAKAFTPGWLENESIWLHMEYKYLLELLKSELYEEFFEDFKTQCIPFIDAESYGRSPLENSSFIASSANPNEKIHGKGFVARLSGSTAEFLHIWQLMMFGKHPFRSTDKGLEFQLEPAIPEYLIDNNLEIHATLLGSVHVVYVLNKMGAVIPGNYVIRGYKLTYERGIVEEDRTGISGKSNTETMVDGSTGINDQKNTEIMEEGSTETILEDNIGTIEEYGTGALQEKEALAIREGKLKELRVQIDLD